jgi:hypothetical protein
MPQGDTFHGAIFWALFWISGLGPLLVMLYIPIGVAWIIGYGIYLGVRRLAAATRAGCRKGEGER